MTADNPPWIEAAKCRTLTPWEAEALFFPENIGRTSSIPGKQFCNGTRDGEPCPVRTQCLTYALDTDSRFGIWGGLSERQRLPMHREVTPNDGRRFARERANG